MRPQIRGRFVARPLDINQLIEETTHLISVSVNKGAVLRLNLGQGLPTIVADASQVRQIVMNLVINASEAIGTRSGVIALTTGASFAPVTVIVAVFATVVVPSATS